MMDQNELDILVPLYAKAAAEAQGKMIELMEKFEGQPVDHQIIAEIFEAGMTASHSESSAALLEAVAMMQAAPTD